MDYIHMNIIYLIIALSAAALLIRVWSGFMNVSSVDRVTLQAVEKKHLYLPGMPTILIGLLITAIFVIIATKNIVPTIVNGSGISSSTIYRTVFVFIAISAFGLFDQLRWQGAKDRYKYFFAFVLGSVATWILISFKRAFFETGFGHDPFLMALGITCVVIGWRFLFGPWSASIKATVLGTFMFWVAYAVLRHETQQELLATGIAAAVAMLPVGVWCTLFLSYHKQRISVVVLAFFAGMLSTIPILFYDAMTKQGIEFNFFLFKITLLSFGGSSNDFAQSGMFSGLSMVQSIILVNLVTYFIVGTIEEFSKYWVLRHSSSDFFRSIDDVLQLAIVVAIGFAFAENLENPNYFVGFVNSYLLKAHSPAWGLFFANVMGRAVLTNMVHILSTGVLGYYFGLAFFASPLLKNRFENGKAHSIIMWIHRLLALKAENIYARIKIIQGITSAIVLHGCFDFVVSLPDMLPGHPNTVGELIGNTSPLLSSISITLIPSLLYVIGGLWLLLYLFERQEDMKEFGAIVQTQTLVQ